MRDPIAGVFNVLSVGVNDLPDSFAMMEAAFAGLRRSSARFGIKRLIAVIHPRPTATGDRWNLHAHGAFEAPAASVLAIDEYWRAMTKRRGHFALQAQTPHVEDEERYARYIAREDDWCPEPHALSPRWFEVLVGALRHRRIRVRWGFRKNAQRWVVRASRVS